MRLDMSSIQLLDQNTINQIAAGEVIDRPASVVKELVENAIDAKATAITVEIKDGGISFIRITDNGNGIEKSEIPLAFLRHATSKIRTAQDLLSVSSLGFRGEALSSIAAIAEVELISKVPSALNGTRYVIEGGEEKVLEEVGAPDGTTFLVRNIFYNTPARKKFLKSPQTEAGYIADIVERIALSHPNISIRFIQNNQNKLHTSGNNRLKDIVYHVYGREITSNLLDINIKNEYASITGFIGKPLISRGNRAFENYYVNGRYIKNALLTKAIEDAYQSFLMQHKYPFTVIHFQIDSELLDVNVHPAKMELRIQNGEQMYQFVVKAIQDTLLQKELIPEVQIEEKKTALKEEANKNSSVRPPEPFETNRMQKEITQKHKIQEVNKNMVNSSAPDWNNSEMIKETGSYMAKQEENKEALNKIKTHQKEIEKPLSSKESKKIEPSAQMNLFEDKLLSKTSRSKHRIIGQLFNTYWLVEFQDKLFIIDQHAAHEKILYEKIMHSLKMKEFTSQFMNPPLVISLTTKEEELLHKYQKYFKEIGFEIEEFGGKEYAIRAVPDNLFGIAKKEIFIEMLDSLSEEIKTENRQVVLEKIASMSCKAAVKGNHRLSEQEANSLIDQLLELDNPYNCPHGRPTIISMNKYEIEKKFKRIV